MASTLLQAGCRSPQRRGGRFLAVNLALSTVAIIVALAAVELFFRAKPEFIPAEVRTYPPVLRVERMIDRTYLHRLSDGDLFHWLQGDITPIPEQEDRVLAKIQYVTDQNGFRNFPSVKAHYDLLALGDSFTRAPNVAKPWTERLSALTGLSVYNIGVSGLGPQGEVNLLEEFGPNLLPRWVLLAYFEGNDLMDLEGYDKAQPFILPRIVKYSFTALLERRRRATSNSSESQEVRLSPSSYRYPVSFSIGERTLSMAFFPAYIAWLALSQEDIERSRNFRLLRTLLLKACETSQALGACFVLVYIPSKPHIYLPHLHNLKTLNSILSGLSLTKLSDDGFLGISDDPITPERLKLSMDAQAEALHILTREAHIPMIDLTPHFRAASADGTLLYYAFDTHWNQKGHDLAARVIAQHLMDNAPAFCGPSLLR